MTNYKHWQVAIDETPIAWVFLDRADSTTNTLSVEVMLEFSELIEQITQNATLKAMIIASKKDNGFIAGADIEQFKHLETIEQAHQVVDGGQAILNKLAALSIPTLAMIQGFCVGGGLELALACRYRIAEIKEGTRLGLPEVKLGIMPGWGGTVRLPALIGGQQALDLMLTGRLLDAKRAERMGLIDAALPKRHLISAAKQIVLSGRPSHHASFLQRLSNCVLFRPWIAKLVRKKVAKLARIEHYPAPYAIIDKWLAHGADKTPAAFAKEQALVCQLAMTETAKHLVRVFFLQERLKGLGKMLDGKVAHVHVIGAGTMGGDIAAWCAYKGLMVTLQDTKIEAIAPAIKRAHQLYKKKYRKDKRAYRAALDRLIPDVSGNGITRADVVIEAIYENLEAKQALFKSLELRAKPTAILASNTSSIPLSEIASGMKQPSRLIGIHFFNPVAQMMLVEIVQTDNTDPKIAAAAASFVGQLGKLPLPVKSSPGFLINRILMPYLMECVSMLQEGINGPTIDEAAKAFGMPMGPLELADKVGLDICLHVGKNLTSHFGGTIPSELETLVSSGRLGMKSGKGFYDYTQEGKVIKKEAVQADQAELEKLAKRLIDRMANEARACLKESVVADSDLLDAGMIFGTGFAPFRGGLIYYAGL